MKILITPPSNNILNCLYNAAQKTHNVILCDRPIYQILDNEKIDCIICESQYLSQTMIAAINEYNIPTIVIGISENFPQKKLTVLTNEINEVILKNITEPIYQLKPAIGTATWTEYPSFDILYISENPEYDKDIISKINYKNYTMKIVGPVYLPFPEYVGNVSYNDMISLIVSSTITILTKPTYLYDIIYREKFVITTFNNEFLTASIEDIPHYLKEDKHRIKITKHLSKSISDNDTYTNRFQEIITQANIL